MNITQTRLLGTGLFFLLIFISGYWLSHIGKPYHGGIFNVHKLIGLALGIFLILTVRRIQQSTPLNSVEITVIAVTVLIFTALVAAGGLLSAVAEGSLSNASQTLLRAIGIIHKVFPYLAVISTGMTLYLLFFRKI